jgi:heme/copper-type cytochrome/quinol oxidase subunit 2
MWNTAAANFKTHKVLFFAILGLILIALTPIPGLEPVQPGEKAFVIEADRYSYSPGVVQVNQGDQVLIKLVSNDVVHGLHIEGYDLNLTAEPGQTAELSFIAQKSGTFRLRCSETCGAMHPFMVGKLQVGNNQLLWRGSAAALLLGLIGVLGLRHEAS